MDLFVAEAFGTMLLVIFGGGVVANVVLGKTKGNGSGWIVISTGWALGVAMAVYAVGRVSGAHINPAVTVGLAAIGSFPWEKVPTYVIAQLFGGFLGGVVVWLAYLPHWAETKDPADKLAVFSTGPAIRSPGANFLCELIGTAVLLLGVLAIGANGESLPKGIVDLRAAYGTGFAPLLVGFLVWAIGLSLGGPTGYAINPARDLGPRIAHAILPISGKGDSDWSYAWIPILAPLLGGVLGALLWKLLAL